MKAVVCQQYGSPDHLRVVDVEPPKPARNEALIRVHAAAANPLDLALLRGRPPVIRLTTGLRRPSTTRPGIDFAGEVLATGADVRRARSGDAVFGVCVTDPHARPFRAWMHDLGSFAELLCVTDSCFVPKPADITYEQAAAVPLAGLTALQGLRDRARLEAGQSVLINGAAGGVGTFAVQIAQAFGAEVAGVCRTANVAMVRSLGATRVIDYTQEDFTRRSERYDVIFDCAGTHSFADLRRVLRPRGVCVSVGQMADGGLLTLAGRLAAGLALSRFSTQKLIPFLARPSRRDLQTLSALLQAGSVRPVVDRCYALSDVSAALRYLETKHAQGKVVTTMNR